MIFPMRSLVPLACCLVLMTACMPQSLPTPPGLEHDPVWTGRIESMPAKAKDAGQSTVEPSMIIPAVDAPIGQVVSVNTALRFVILDFPLHPMPQQDQRLFIYRINQRVGVVKVTGPSHGRTTAADLIDGEARVGDRIRPD